MDELESLKRKFSKLKWYKDFDNQVLNHSSAEEIVKHYEEFTLFCIRIESAKYASWRLLVLKYDNEQRLKLRKKATDNSFNRGFMIGIAVMLFAIWAW